MYSPVASSDRPMGANAMMAITVAPSSGQMVWRTISTAASSFDIPRFMPTRMPSVTTMALSTSMPRAIISAPREIRCRSMASTFMTIKVPRMVSSSTPPISRPERTPMNTSNTAMTMAMASPRLSRKAPTELSTSWGWLYTVASSMPAGRWYSSSARRCSTRAPTSTTLTPFEKEIPRVRAASPLNR